MKKDYKRILEHNDIITAPEVLTLDYHTETGHGTIKIDMVQKIPATAHDIKLIIDITRRADDPKAAAAPLYNYLKKCLDFLNLLLEKTPNDTDQDKKDRAEITNEIKKYNRNLDALLKVYDFDQVETAEAVTMKNVNIVKLGQRHGVPYAENVKGKRFVKAGHVFHVYKTKNDCYILIPCTGLAAVVYNGNIADAPEYITDDLISKLDKLDYTQLQKRLLDIAEAADNVILNDDIYITYTAETEEEKTTEVNQEPDTIEIKDDEIITNQKQVTYNNKRYKIWLDCVNNYVIECKQDYIIINKNIDLIEANPGITDDKKIELLQIYKIVAAKNALPINSTEPAPDPGTPEDITTATEPTAETTPAKAGQHDDTHDTPRHSEALQTRNKPPYYIAVYIPTKSHTKGTRSSPGHTEQTALYNYTYKSPEVYQSYKYIYDSS